MDGMNIVNILWDEEAKVYVAICDSLGITLESENYDDLMQKVVDTAPEMAELKGVVCQNLVFCTFNRQYNFA